MSSKSPSLSTQSIAVFIGQVSGFAVNFLTPVLLVRLISKSDYGVLQQFVLMGNTLLPILGLGLASSLYYFYPISKGADRESHVFNTWFQMLISGAAFTILFSFLGKEILSLLGMEILSQAGKLVGIYILFLLSGTLIDFLFILEKKVRMSMIFNPIDKTFRLLLVAGSAFFTETVFYCLVALVLYAALRFSFISFYVLRHYYSPTVWGSFRINVSTQLRYSLPFAAGVIFTTVSQRIDKLLVNRYISEEDFAIYSLAFFSIPLINQAFTSINNVVIPNISKLFDEGNKVEVVTLYRTVVSKTSALAIPAVLFFTVMAPELISFLFTSDYLESTPYYRVYLLTLLFTMLSFGIVLRASGNTNQIMLSNFTGMVITLIAAFWLIPKFQLTGAITTAVVGVGGPALLQVYFTSKLLDRSVLSLIPIGVILKLIAISTVGFGVIIPLKLLLSDTLLTLIFATPLYAVIIWSLEVRFGVFPFMNQQNKILKRFRP